MSLNFQFTNLEQFNNLTEEDKKWNDAFIWGCMIIDLGEITEKNAEEWEWRYRFMVKLNGAHYYKRVGKEDVPYIPTIEEVRKRVGLHTNVSNRTRNQFIQKQVRIFNSK